MKYLFLPLSLFSKHVFFIQGNLVRELKSSGADKEKINEAVQILLAAKRELALATGENPEPASKGKKKGKKK